MVIASLLLFNAGGCMNSERHEAHDHEGHSHEAHNHEHEGDNHDGHDNEHEGEGKGDSADEIIFPVQKAKAAGVEVSIAKRGDFSETIATSGRILTSSGEESQIAATRSGIVRLLRPWSIGMSVGAGTPLFSISAANLPEGDISRRAAIEFDRAKAEFSRAEELYKEKLMTATDYQAAKSAYENARLNYEAVGSKTGAATITSPRSGYVITCQVKDGEYVEVGSPMMTISQNRRLRLQADLPVREYGNIGSITTANFKPTQGETTYSMASLNGKVISYGRASEGSVAFIPIIFEFDNASGIAAGSFAEVWLKTGVRHDIISVPKEALTEEQGKYYLYIQIDEEGYEKRGVKIGKNDGSNVEILSGLNEGERYVSKGAINVKLASASSAIPGHTHNH